MKKITIAIILIILLSFVIAAVAYQKIETNKVASHWNAKGEVDGYMSKFWGLFICPLMLVGLGLVFLLIPRIDPLRKNLEKFRRYYDIFVLFIMIFMFYVFILTIAANFGFSFNMTTMLMPAVGLLFFGIGLMMKKLERNWFIGIRTPWTISNDEVWKKTHKLGAIHFKVLGIIIFLGIFFQDYILWLILIPIIISITWLFVYSYLEYRTIEKR